MDTAVEIKIGDATFKPAFGLKVFRELGKHWKKETLNEVIEELQVLESITDNIPLKVFDMIYDLILFSVNCNKENTVKLTLEELEELPMEELLVIVTQVTAIISDSMPQQPVEEKK